MLNLYKYNFMLVTYNIHKIIMIHFHINDIIAQSWYVYYAVIV